VAMIFMQQSVEQGCLAGAQKACEYGGGYE